jgi:hypothetical protein
VFDFGCKNGVRRSQIIAGIEHAIALRAVARPLLDFVVGVIVRNEGAIGLFIGSVILWRVARSFGKIHLRSFF